MTEIRAVKIIKKRFFSNAEGIWKYSPISIISANLLFLAKSYEMRRTILTIILSLIVISLGAHPWKPRHYVIIDSDGGIDDLKAICMMMASPDVRILAITVSDGFHKAPVAYENIRKMVNALHHEGLPVAEPGEAIALIEKILGSETTPVKFIVLGSLT